MSTRKIIVKFTVQCLAGIGLLTVGFYMQRWLVPPDPCLEDQKVTVVVWNKADQDIEVTVRPRHGNTSYLDIAHGVRGCLTVNNPEGKKQLPLKALSVRYDNHTYWFNDQQMLNAHVEDLGNDAIPVRYLAVMVLGTDHEQWLTIKDRLVKEGIDIHDKERYLVLSNHPKVGSFWDVRARIKVLRLKRDHRRLIL